MSKDAIGLYAHIPFCARKCAYCDFISYPDVAEATMHRYVDALVREMDLWREAIAERAVQSVFIGGGTPSLLPGGEVSRMLWELSVRAGWKGDAEVTIEFNPGTLTIEKALEYKKAGVNRVSLGMQAAQQRLLYQLGRIHTVQQCREAVSLIRRAGIDNISVDLMFGLPGQTIYDWEETLRQALGLGVEHISCYALEVGEDTPLGKQVQANMLVLPDAQTERRMDMVAERLLLSRGFERYEISNYAMPGRQSRHNTLYWENGEYLGLGCAAHGCVDGVRYENVKGLDKYLSAVALGNKPIRSAKHIPRGESMFETVMLGLRMTRGVDLRRFQARYGVEFDFAFPGVVDDLAAKRLVERVPGYVRLTPRGRDIQNSVLMFFMED